MIDFKKAGEQLKTKRELIARVKEILHFDNTGFKEVLAEQLAGLTGKQCEELIERRQTQSVGEVDALHNFIKFYQPIFDVVQFDLRNIFKLMELKKENPGKYWNDDLPF